MSGGVGYACALLETGDVTCWGYNGNDRAAGYAGGDAIGVSAGGYHACALLASGNVECWGTDDFGESTPYLGGNALAVSAGYHHTCVLLTSGNVDCWGLDTYGGAADYLGGDAVAVSASWFYTCALLDSGDVSCWGYGAYGQSAGYTGGDAISMSAGHYHACALLSSGNVECWGSNDASTAVGYSGGEALGMFTGHFDACVLMGSGNVHCWDPIHAGQETSYLEGDAVSLGVGSNFICVVVESGKVVCWGDNQYGQAAGYAVEPSNSAPTATLSLTSTGHHTATVAISLHDSDSTDSVTGLLDWGDGTSETIYASGTYSHAYPGPGPHAVTLTPTDSQGLEGSAVSVTFADANTAPAATLTVSGRDLSATATATLSDAEGDAVTAILDWGDGTIETVSAGGVYHHTYTTSGPYPVTVTPTDGHGLQGRSAMATYSGMNHAPTASLALRGAPRTVFATVALSDPNGDNVTAVILWGDGSNQTVTESGIYSHTYTSAGRYTVRVTPTDEYGLTGETVSGVFDSATTAAKAIAITSSNWHTCALLESGNVHCWGEHYAEHMQDYAGGDAIGVATTDSHTCALLSTGNVRCWGSNDKGQAEPYLGGDATKVAATEGRTCVVRTTGNAYCWGDFTEVATNPYHGGDAVDVTTGEAHTCVLRTSGRVTCWGSNYYGQLESPTEIDHVAISADYRSTCAVRSSGNVTCWGWDYYEQVTVYGGGDAVDLSESCALLASGNITCWGRNYYGEADPYTRGDAVGVSVGHTFTCALLRSGDVTCWGPSSLGAGNRYHASASPAPKASLSVSGSRLTAVATVHLFSPLGKEVGAVLAWGDGTTLTLTSGGTFSHTYSGPGTFTLTVTPVDADGLQGTPRSATFAAGATGPLDAIAVTAGHAHTCALLANGNVTCWGSNEYGQAAGYSGGDAVAVGAGPYYTCVVLRAGSVDCWGHDYYGTTLGYEGSDAIAVSLNELASCALLASGNVYCWGYNGQYQAVGYMGGDAVAVRAGRDYACALTSAGNVYCWGSNAHDQAAHYLEGDAMALATGYSHACIVLPSGNVTCWGYLADIESSYGGGDAVDVALSYGHWCALLRAGTVRCFGDSGAYTPHFESGDAVAVTAGRYHSCALRASGNVHCWGYGSSGETRNYVSSSNRAPLLQVGGTSLTGLAAVNLDAVYEDIQGALIDWGDGSAASPVRGSGTYRHTYALPGSYRITLTLSGPDGALGSVQTETFDARDIRALDTVAFSAGPAHTCALLGSGNITCMGHGYYPHLEPYLGGDAIAVSASSSHTCALLVTGNVHCWGSNDYGQAVPYLGGNAVAVSTHSMHTCILLRTGNIECWGYGNWDQMHLAPYPGGDAIGVSAGQTHTCALLVAGDIVCWGGDDSGQSADYLGGDAVGVSAGSSHTCALLAHGNVTCWGGDVNGERLTYHGGDAVAVSAGSGATCILLTSGNATCSGGTDWWGETAGYWRGDAVGVSVGDFRCVHVVTGEVRCFTYYGYDQSLSYDGAPDAPRIVLSVDGHGFDVRVTLTYLDSDDDHVNALLDWGDGSTPYSLGMTAGQSETLAYTYWHGGYYTLTVTPTDEHDLSGAMQTATFHAATPVPDAPVFETIVNVYSGYYSDTATFGARYDATSGYDYGIDFAEPPAPPGDFVRAYFADGGSGTTSRLDRSFLAAEAPIEWAFVVERLDRSAGDASSWVTLTWSPESFAPFYDTFDVYLIDGGNVVNMRTQDWYSLETPEGSAHSVHEMVIRVVERSTMVASFDIPLHAGWNLVSLPVLPEDLRVSAVFAGLPVEVVYAADRSMPDMLEAGRAYWVLVTTDAVLHVEGAVLERVETGPLAVGWHLVGGPSGADAPVEVSGSAESTLWTYVVDGSGRRYELREARTQPGEGYWVFVHEEGTRLTIRRGTMSA